MARNIRHAQRSARALHPAPSFQLKCHVTAASSQTSFILRTRHLPSPLLDFSRFSYFTWSVNGDVFDGVSFLKWKSPIRKNNLKCHMFEGIISHTLHHDRDGNLVRFMAHGIRSHFSSSENTPATSGEHRETK